MAHADADLLHAALDDLKGSARVWLQTLPGLEGLVIQEPAGVGHAAHLHPRPQGAQEVGHPVHVQQHAGSTSTKDPENIKLS